MPIRREPVLNTCVFFCPHRREFSEYIERQHIELAGKRKTDRSEEQMVEGETRRRSVSGECHRIFARLPEGRISAFGSPSGEVPRKGV